MYIKVTPYDIIPYSISVTFNNLSPSVPTPSTDNIIRMLNASSRETDTFILQDKYNIKITHINNISFSTFVKNHYIQTLKIKHFIKRLEEDSELPF
jgi:hypothetical protein